MSEDQDEAPAPTKADPDPGDPNAVVVPDEGSVNENEVGVPGPTESPPSEQPGESATVVPSASDADDAATSDEPVAGTVEERNVQREDLPERVTASTDPVTGKTVYTVLCDCGAKWPTTVGTDRTKCPRCNKMHELT